MDIYDETKTKKLDEKDIDIEKGYLKDDKLVIHHKEIVGQEEEGHFEIIAEYENGGKEIEWIIDKPYIKHENAYDEEIPIQVYIKYTEEELKKREINIELSKVHFELSQTDYKAIKYFEGYYTEEEYQPIKEYRESLREQIRALENEISE